MRTIELLNYLECGECEQRIPLLATSQGGKRADLPWWPMNLQPLNFLGLFCKHVYAYRFPDVFTAMPHTTARTELYKRLGVFCIRIGCGWHGCDAQAKVYAVARVSEDVPTIVSDLGAWQRRFLEAIPTKCFCQDQHPLTPKTFQKANDTFPTAYFVAPVYVP